VLGEIGVEAEERLEHRVDCVLWEVKTPTELIVEN
jgi:hypothetical protein